MELIDLYRDVIQTTTVGRAISGLGIGRCQRRGFNPCAATGSPCAMKMDDDKIDDIRFEGQGCAISTASASLMTEAVKGRTRADALRLFEPRTRTAHGRCGAAADEPRQTRGVVRSTGVSRSLVKCASLCWHTLASALRSPDPQVLPPVTTSELLKDAFVRNDPSSCNAEVKAVAIPAGRRGQSQVRARWATSLRPWAAASPCYIDGNLFRITGQDADAIGKSAQTAPEVPPELRKKTIKNIVWQQLKTCYDPENPRSISSDLGLVTNAMSARTKMRPVQWISKWTLTAPGCGMGEVLVRMCATRCK